MRPRLPDAAGASGQEPRRRPESNADNHLYLDDFTPYRDCLIWSLQPAVLAAPRRLGGGVGQGFEAALPGGTSDANHPQAVADSVADFWTLLRDLENARSAAGRRSSALEIGVGSGARAAAWLDRFKALDEQCGTGYYSRLQFILGDYSPTTLERALAAVAHHGDARQRRRRSTRSTRSRRCVATASRSCTCT